jgi:Reverse transcriptase (RNA-dependent DNA polymerase)
LYQWTTVPFGIRNGPAAFQRLLHSVLAVFTFECSYLDDIIVYSKSSEQLVDALNKVYTALRDAGLKLNASKCSFGVNRVTYLGHIISKHGIEADPDKVQAVRDFSVPRNTTEVRAFHAFAITFADSYRILVRQKMHFKTYAKNDAKLLWTDIQQLLPLTISKTFFALLQS